MRRRIRDLITGAPSGTLRHWIVLSLMVSRLGAGRLGRVRFLAAALTAPLRDRLRWRTAVTARLRVGQLVVAWRLGPKSDFGVLQEIFTQRAYELSIPTPSVILDLGSHMGASLLYFRSRYPDARIIGVEPDPRTFERLRQNAAQLGVEVRHAAVTPRDGEVTFYPARQGWSSSLYPNGSDPVVVTGRSLDSLLDELGLATVDLLKLDVEGAEHDLLASSRRLSDVRMIVGELHDTRASDAFAALLAPHFCVEIEPSSNDRPTFVAVNRGGRHGW